MHDESASPLQHAAVLILLIAYTGHVAAMDSPLAAVAGCPMAHCDARNGDIAGLTAPAGVVGIVWSRDALPGEAAGSLSGLGCSADGTLAVCAYAGASHNLVAYDYDGSRLWTSGVLLDRSAFASAPMILEDGVVAADSRGVVKFDRSGELLWWTALPQGGLPISPVMTAGGVIVLATKGGPVYAVDAMSGAMLAFRYVRLAGAGAGFFESLNTPAVRANRVYLSSQSHRDDATQDAGLASLIALDVDRTAADAQERLQVAWHFDFGTQSRSSPLLIGDVLYFDVQRPDPDGPVEPHIFAVQDTGSAPLERWRIRLEPHAFASFARDPRPDGGFWHPRFAHSRLTRRRESDGTIMQSIDIDALIAESGRHFPNSAMTIAGPAEAPAMLLSASALGGRAHVIAVDLVRETLLWKVPIADDPDGSSAGQFPLLTDGTDVRAVFTSWHSGARAIGARLDRNR